MTRPTRPTPDAPAEPDRLPSPVDELPPLTEEIRRKIAALLWPNRSGGGVR